MLHYTYMHDIIIEIDNVEDKEGERGWCSVHIDLEVVLNYHSK